jgi:hypothetical protein
MTTDDEQRTTSTPAARRDDALVSKLFESFANAVAGDPDEVDRIRRIGRALAEAAPEAKVSSAIAADGASAGRPTGRTPS